jgi:hypothetical protein
MGDVAVVEMFRPIGPRELDRIRELGFRAFPPRLHFQPIFYPVFDEGYARQIARDWNATKPETGYRGFVTRFRVRAEFIGRFDIQTVGGREHQELWIPADELDDFNSHIVGEIEVIAAYQGAPGALPTEVPIASIT